MARRKLQRFAANELAPNIIQPGKELFHVIKGNWREKYFQNQNPISLELACGRGEYTVGLAKLFPERNFIGIDIKGDRLWKGSTLALENQLKNVAFLRIQIQLLENFFDVGEVNEIWLIHPDPRPKNADARRRLTHPRFLDMYRRILEPNGWVRLKTDNDLLFDYTLEVLQQFPIRNLEWTRNLYESSLLSEHYQITTKYETMFVAEGHTIKYLKFQFDHHESPQI
ncbi:MAG: tRNA (guanosine(46)-N7)-methyltransferase TrmB [Cytophagales bacterium]|nr:tRNA (guanosine(46)-N7)-methyltransferase TrmB [Cytophagales bacterium]MDW8385356.1 tRNA (guanosine(46)-N7)-methyltransferase TrmB [Flammeovirgaceae bacterium]